MSWFIWFYHSFFVVVTIRSPPLPKETELSNFCKVTVLIRSVASLYKKQSDSKPAPNWAREQGGLKAWTAELENYLSMKRCLQTSQQLDFGLGNYFFVFPGMLSANNNDNPYLGLLGGLNKLIQLKYLKLFLAHY